MSSTEPSTESASSSSSPASSAPTTPHLTSSTSLNYELQVTAPPIDSQTQHLINQLRTDLTSNPLYTTHPSIQHYCTDTLLHKYIRARPQSLHKAETLLLDTLQWRQQYRPDLILAREVADECRTGKILVRECDQYGRPMIVMNNHYNKTNDHDAAIRQLVFWLELASQRMTPPVEKYCLFINLTHHSFFNQPPMKTSMTTLTMLTDRYPECMGTAIVYQPPTVFNALWTVCRGLMDAKMVSKIVFIKGDDSDGTENDRVMRGIVGHDWRRKCDVGVSEDERWVFDRDWPAVVQENRERLERQGLWEEANKRADGGTAGKS